MLKKLALTLALTLGLALPALAAEFPTRPITIIVPFGAGGETDIVARLLAENMSKLLGQNVAVQNIVGASGVTGINQVLTSKADGYTLGFCPSAPLAIHPHMREVPYTLDSFAFVGRALNAPYFLITQKNSPWKSVDDMSKDLKANPGKYFWGSTGVGSLPFMAIGEVFGKLGLDASAAKQVAFSGDSDVFQAMAGDRVQLYSTTAGTINNFDVKPLAIMDAARDPAFPDTPTFKELGFDVEVSQWMMLFAPSKVPADVLGRLSNAMDTACKSPEFAEQLKKLGLNPGYLNAADAKAFILDQSAVYKQLLQEMAKNQ